MIALVLGVIAASTWSGSIVQVSRVTSTMTGRALVLGEGPLEPRGVRPRLGEPAPIAAPDRLGDGLDVALVEDRPRRVPLRPNGAPAPDRELGHRDLLSVARRRVPRRLDLAGTASLASDEIVRKVSYGSDGVDDLGGHGGQTGAERTFAAGPPSLLRAINERTVLERIPELGPVSRAQLARATGLC